MSYNNNSYYIILLLTNKSVCKTPNSSYFIFSFNICKQCKEFLHINISQKPIHKVIAAFI